MSSLAERLAAARASRPRAVARRRRLPAPKGPDGPEPSADPAAARAQRAARTPAAVSARLPSRRAATPSPTTRVTNRRGNAEYERLEELKHDVHTELLKQLGPQLYDANLDQADLDQRVRAVLAQLMSSQERPISNADRNRLTQEISDDILGYGPIEPFLRDVDVSEVMVNGPDSIWLERDGRLVKANAHLQRRGPHPPHDRQDRLPHRPPRRRVEPDGGRPPPRRQPCQRGHPAAGDRRLHADHP